MPWRALPGQRPQPYHVWLSEIMLQQTTVAAVYHFYLQFLQRFPRIHDLAAAPQTDVLAAWSGLGYYSRARNLHLCAQEIIRRGHFPETVSELLTLPGVGPYTARAIAAIAFDVPVVPVDGNVERVTARLFAITEPLPSAKKHIAALASGLNAGDIATQRASDFAQALFDLGATVCTPRKPSCVRCPWQSHCAAYSTGDAERFPVKLPKPARPIYTGASCIVEGPDARIWIQRRPAKGLLAGMMELPGTIWRQSPTPHQTPPPAVLEKEWIHCGQIKHVFTHLTLFLDIYQTRITSWKQLERVGLGENFILSGSNDGIACAHQDLERHALPSLTRKALALQRVTKA